MGKYVKGTAVNDEPITHNPSPITGSSSPITRHWSPITGFYTLFRKEWLRFWKVSVQTILAPVLTALLFLVVFAYSLRGHAEVFAGVSYTAFLAPGLAMMSVLQN